MIACGFLFQKYLMQIIPVCPSKVVQKSCILCGGFRSFLAFVRFQLKLSFDYNQLVFWILILLVVNYTVLLLNLFTNYVRTH